jgi:DNA-binding XRE family transcriptional regulator
MYNPYHEMDISQSVDRIIELSQQTRMETYLKKYRKMAGLTQSQLSEETGIPIKTIQQYEQGRKDINKAQAEYVIKLAQVLCCNPVDLLEIRK